MTTSVQGDAPRRNILIVYRLLCRTPLRNSIADHLYSFERHSGDRCYYLNMAVRGVPRYLERVKFDLVVFHTSFLSGRWYRLGFRDLMRRAAPLKRLDAVKVALPQDEFISTDLLCEFINDYDIDVVYSVAPETEFAKIYPTVDRRKVRFRTVLTGYLEDATVERIKAVAREGVDRGIDIGYRAWRAEPWLGRHGMLKTQIAEVFQQRAPENGLNTDISTAEKATLLGDDWYRFLLACKYTIGVEGGASILDFDGSLRDRVNQFVREHPQATFEEVEAACFPGCDGTLGLLALSPRHLEACATRTCQVLIEGDYNGILQPDVHYIPLKRDFSNLGDVLQTLKDDKVRTAIAERAYQDVVATGRYSYQGFVRFILEDALKGRAPRPQGPLQPLVYRWMRIAERLSWVWVNIVAGGLPAILRLMPPGARLLLRRLRGKAT